MSKKKRVSIAIAIVALGLLAFLLATHKTQRYYVEDLQRQLPDAVTFINENQELLDLLLKIKDRINEYNEEHEETKIISYYMYPGVGDEKRLGMTVSYTDPANDVKAVHEGDRFDIFSKDERARINQAQGLQCIAISTVIINISYADSGWATLNIENPISIAVGADKRGDKNYWYNWFDEKDYSCFWYNEIIDGNWFIQLMNRPRG